MEIVSATTHCLLASIKVALSAQKYKWSMLVQCVLGRKWYFSVKAEFCLIFLPHHSPWGNLLTLLPIRRCPWHKLPPETYLYLYETDLGVCYQFCSDGQVQGKILRMEPETERQKWSHTD